MHIGSIALDLNKVYCVSTVTVEAFVLFNSTKNTDTV